MIATPALWYPEQDQAEWEAALESMVERSKMTQALLQGKITPDVFLDYLAETYADPLEVAEVEASWQVLGTFSS